MGNCSASSQGKAENRQGCSTFYVFIHMLQYNTCMQYHHYSKQTLHCYLIQIIGEIGAL